MEFIPAIDLIDGSCVRLTKGDYSTKKVYDSEPLEVAKRFESLGVKRLHLVDLDGAKAGRPINLAVLEKISSETSLVIDYGGGLKREEDLNSSLDAGASLLVVGSAAVRTRERFLSWVKNFGADRFILASDCREEMVAIDAWEEKTELSVFDFIDSYISHGICRIMVTDVAVDGTLSEPNFELYRRLMERFPAVSFIASGGVASIEQIEKLSDIGLGGAVVGKAIYEGKISAEQIKSFLKS